MSIKGFPNQKKLEKTLAPYTDAQTKNTSEYVTVQPTYSDKNGLDSVQLGLYRTHASAKTATPDATWPTRIFTSTSHGASPGDVVRFEPTATNPGFESGIKSVPDADTIIMNGETPVDIDPADTFFILRYITPRYGSDGSTVTTIDPAGLATAANQVTQIAAEQAIQASAASIDTKLSSQATAANQATEITALGTLNTSVNTLLKPASTLAAVTSITNPVAVTGTFWQATQPVSGTVTANAGTNLNTSLLALDSTVAKDASLTTLNTSVNTLLKPASTLAAVTTVGAVTSITNALPVGANVIGKVSIDQTTPGTTNLVALTAETTKIIGAVVDVGTASATNALTSISSSANEASHVVKGSAGRLYSFSGYNAKTSAQFIQIHNATSLPSNTAVPIFTFTVPASSNWSYDFFLGRYFSTGITVCNSSTQATLTVGSTDCWFNAEYL